MFFLNWLFFGKFFLLGVSLIQQELGGSAAGNDVENVLTYVSLPFLTPPEKAVCSLSPSHPVSTHSLLFFRADLPGSRQVLQSALLSRSCLSEGLHLRDDEQLP